MNDDDFVKTVLTQLSIQMAKNIQKNSNNMSATEIVVNKNFIPSFNPSRQYLNFKIGYLCKTFSGNVVKLLEPYDSIANPEEPEKLPSKWRFLWSTDPSQAKPFKLSSTSPYLIGDICVFKEKLWRSLANNNLYSPTERPDLWEKL